MRLKVPRPHSAILQGLSAFLLSSHTLLQTNDGTSESQNHHCPKGPDPALTSPIKVAFQTEAQWHISETERSAVPSLLSFPTPPRLGYCEK